MPNKRVTPLISTVETDSGTQVDQAAVQPVSEPTMNNVASEVVVASSAKEGTKPNDRAVLWLRRGDQIVVGLLVASLLVLLGIHWLRLSRWGSAPVELSSQQPREYYYSLDINSASWVEWAQLDGIGEKLAKRIVADRDERGPFRSPAFFMATRRPWVLTCPHREVARGPLRARGEAGRVSSVSGRPSRSRGERPPHHARGRARRRRHRVPRDG